MSLNMEGLEETDTTDKGEVLEREVVIIGAGPAGLTAGLYAGRAQLEPLILVGESFGGQVAMTGEIENYPGFPEGIDGMALAEQMSNHAERFGAEIAYEQVIEVDFESYPFVLETYGPTYKAKSVIICTGASPRKLGVPGEQEFAGRGVSYCAMCDGYFFRDKTVVVVGGGDSALDEALYLTRLAKEVIIVHRRDELRAGAALRERAFANDKVRFVWDTAVEEIEGGDTVTGVRVRNVKTEERDVIPCDGVFIYVGLVPNTELFEGQLELGDDGYIITDKHQQTNLPGVYAAGDVQDPWFRQAIIAAGAGAAAAITAERFLSEKSFDGRKQKQRG